jgi:hypothetical protein
MQTISSEPVLRSLTLAAWVIALVNSVGAASPSLSVSLVPPASLQVSWPTNFATGSWQLLYTTNLVPANWQPVPQTPTSAPDAVSVLIPLAGSSGYYRLQQVGGGGGCTFQATPAVIIAGQSSTLSWCPQDGTSYQVSPGPGSASGGSLAVSPTVTTVYSLTSSNASGIVTNFATVIVGPCGWLQVKNWDAKLYFDYGDSGSTPGYNFSIRQRVGLIDDITFHLTPQSSTATDAYYFGPATGGIVSINDREDVKTPPPSTTTEVGSGPPALNVSYLSLHLTCTGYDFSYNVVMNNVTETSSEFGATSIYDGVGTGAMASRSLSVTNSVIEGSENVPVQYPPVGAEYFVPSSDLGKAGLSTGVLPSPGINALVQWTFTPVQ